MILAKAFGEIYLTNKSVKEIAYELGYDDEHYFMGGTLAERLKMQGHDVTLVTPMATASSWTVMTDEQFFVQKRLLDLGVKIILSHSLFAQNTTEVRLACIYTERNIAITCQTLILVTGRVAENELADSLQASDFNSVTRIGDCLAPSSIADAVYRSEERRVGKEC